MTNTVIQLKKSSTPSATPADLANGEIAINYADGKLFYKDSSGSIQQISSGGNTFSTVNAAGTLLVSDLPTDILNIVAGDNIEISADALTDTFTITANLSNVSGAASVTTSDTAPVSPSDGDLWYNTTIGKMLVYYDDGSSSQWVEATTGQLYTDSIITSGAFSKANDSYALAQTAFDRANTSNDVLFVVGAYDKANAANLLAYGTGIGANAYSDSVGTSANNFAGAMANAANAYAASLTPDLSPVFLVANAAFDKANAANVLACTAFDRANSKVASVTGTEGQIFSSGGTTPTLNLITTAVTSAIYGGSTQIPVINIDSYGRITSASNVAVQGMDYAYVNSSIDVANAYSRVFANSVGSAANANLSVGTTAANAYTDTVVAANLVTARSYANTKVDTITSNSTSRIWANSVTVSGIETVYMDLSTSGVTSATYGGTGQIPTFAVDAYGRLTSASNVSVSYISSVTSTGVNNVTITGANSISLTAVATGATATGGISAITYDNYGRVTSVTGSGNYLANTTGTFAGALTTTGQIYANSQVTIYATDGTQEGGQVNLNGAAAYPTWSIDNYQNSLRFFNGNTGYQSVQIFNSSTGTVNVGINRSGTSGYALDVVGTINASNVLVNGSPISANLSGYATNSSPSFTGTVTFNANLLSQTLTDGASIAWDASLGQIATVTLGGNRALANASNLKVGTYILHVVQDGSGGRTLSYGSQYKWAGGVAPVLTTTIGARDLISFVSDGTLMYGSFLPDVK